MAADLLFSKIPLSLSALLHSGTWFARGAQVWLRSPPALLALLSSLLQSLSEGLVGLWILGFLIALLLRSL